MLNEYDCHLAPLTIIRTSISMHAYSRSTLNLNSSCHGSGTNKKTQFPKFYEKSQYSLVPLFRIRTTCVYVTDLAQEKRRNKQIYLTQRHRLAFCLEKIGQ